MKGAVHTSALPWLIAVIVIAFYGLVGQLDQADASGEWAEAADLADAQHAAEQRERFLKASRAQCLRDRGAGALMFETPEGHLVCRARRST